MENIEIFTILNDFTTIKEFVTKVQTCEGDVDISSTDARYVVDAKSIMGVFSLDLSKPVCITFHEREDYYKLADYINTQFPMAAINKR